MNYELSDGEQLALHQRISRQDLTAFSELFSAVHGILQKHLTAKFPQENPADRDDIIVELLFSYLKNPEKFDPTKLSLFAYLRMAAERDTLNFVEREKRRARREIMSFDEPHVEDRLLERNILTDNTEDDELFAEFRGIQLETLIERLNVNDRDAAFIRLLAQGERSTQPYAEILGISPVEITEQRRIVKQHKDRLSKWLIRQGPKRLRP